MAWKSEVLAVSLAMFPFLFFGSVRCALATGGGYGDQLQIREGRYFRVGVPRGWRVNENTNAVEVSAPDGKTGYSFILLMGGFGQMTPREFLGRQLQNGPYQSPEVLQMRQLPNQPGPMGIPWQVIEADLRFGYQGTRVNAHVTCGVIEGAGQYCAVLRAYQAPVGSWNAVRGLLASVDDSLRITNPYQVAGIDRVQLPKGASHDETYGGFNKGYTKRQAESEARLSKLRREGTMGVERVKDPNTGRIYDMPTSRYDPTISGYRNPYDPTQVLVPAEPGE